MRDCRLPAPVLVIPHCKPASGATYLGHQQCTAHGRCLAGSRGPGWGAAAQRQAPARRERRRHRWGGSCQDMGAAGWELAVPCQRGVGQDDMSWARDRGRNVPKPSRSRMCVEVCAERPGVVSGADGTRCAVVGGRARQALGGERGVGGGVESGVKGVSACVEMAGAEDSQRQVGVGLVVAPAVFKLTALNGLARLSGLELSVCYFFPLAGRHLLQPLSRGAAHRHCALVPSHVSSFYLQHTPLCLRGGHCNDCTSPVSTEETAGIPDSHWEQATELIFAPPINIFPRNTRVINVFGPSQWMPNGCGEGVMLSSCEWSGCTTWHVVRPQCDASKKHKGSRHSCRTQPAYFLLPPSSCPGKGPEQHRVDGAVLRFPGAHAKLHWIDRTLFFAKHGLAKKSISPPAALHPPQPPKSLISAFCIASPPACLLHFTPCRSIAMDEQQFVQLLEGLLQRKSWRVAVHIIPLTFFSGHGACQVCHFDPEQAVLYLCGIPKRPSTDSMRPPEA